MNRPWTPAIRSNAGKSRRIAFRRHCQPGERRRPIDTEDGPRGFAADHSQFACHANPPCLTLSYMKSSALTIRLDRALERQLAQLAKRSGRSRSDIARDALRRQLAILQFEDARRQVMPFAEARGYLTDEDVFRDIS